MPVTLITWNPKSVSTIGLTSFSRSLKTASSNGLTIAPRANQPRSPPWAAEPGSCELALASSANRAGSLRTSAASASMRLRASSRSCRFGATLVSYQALISSAGIGSPAMTASSVSSAYSARICSGTSNSFGCAL